MATFQGVERTNYVQFRPEMMELLTAYCGAFDIALVERDRRHAIMPRDPDVFVSTIDGDDVTERLYELLRSHGQLEEAGLPLADSITDLDVEDELELELELDFSLVATWMEPGEVLVVESAGHEKLRYVSAFAAAYNHKGDEVAIDLNDIYAKAAESFGVNVNSISQAAY